MLHIKSSIISELIFKNVISIFIMHLHYITGWM